jgi:hypothetical protein
MQPTYLPWSGYFNLASKVDIFVFLDDVQFERQSWQSRNKILANGMVHLLSVPILRDGLQTQLRNIKIGQINNWQNKHLRSIQNSYPLLWRDSYLSQSLENIINKKYNTLVDLNIATINLLFDWLDLSCKTVRSSDLECSGLRSDRLIEICRKIRADSYISPIGSRDYLEKDNFEKKAGIPLIFNDFIPEPHPQGKGTEFISHLSVIDVIGHCGLEYAKEYIRR